MLRQSTPCAVRFRGEKQVAPMQAEPWKALMSMLRTILVAHTRAACGRCAVGQEATERADVSGERGAPYLLALTEVRHFLQTLDYPPRRATPSKAVSSGRSKRQAIVKGKQVQDAPRRPRQ
eukprot:scaffold7211_cov71-Phaeocystis_antarctica.AAC.2